MKLTPWFVNGEKPVRPGVYEVSVGKPGTQRFDPAYSYFNGKTWAEYLWFKDCGNKPQDAYDGREENKGAGRTWHGAALPRSPSNDPQPQRRQPSHAT